jgi:hypothetical protein
MFGFFAEWGGWLAESTTRDDRQTIQIIDFFNIICAEQMLICRPRTTAV